jgi:hypothetical protein
MSIDNPVGGPPQDPYERYRILREEEQRHGKKKPPDKKPYLAAQILALIKKTVESLLKFTKRGEDGEASPQENLASLKTAFNTLKREDRSQDVPFLNQMSAIWHHILEDSLKIKRSDPLFHVFDHFLQDVQSYPLGEEFSFAYYLTEYTGQEWLPFPYMDLVHKIHQDYQDNPNLSALERWTRKIDELLGFLAD